MSEPRTTTRVTPSCHLIQIPGATVLTGPCSSGRVLCHPGETAAAGAGDLPRLDAVLITRHHDGRCDLAAFRGKAIPVIAAGPAAGTERCT